MGGNTLLYGEGFSDFYRYKVRAFRKKTNIEIGLFIDRLLTKKNNRHCRRTGGGFAKNAKLFFFSYFEMFAFNLSTPARSIGVVPNFSANSSSESESQSSAVISEGSNCTAIRGFVAYRAFLL